MQGGAKEDLVHLKQAENGRGRVVSPQIPTCANARQVGKACEVCPKPRSL